MLTQFNVKQYTIKHVLLIFVFLCLLVTILVLHRQQSDAKAILDQLMVNHEEIRQLIEKMPKRNQGVGYQVKSLFARINTEAEKLKITHHIKVMQPITTQQDSMEKLELQLTDLALKQCVELLYALESYHDISFDTISIRKTENKFLDVDFTISKHTQAQ